MTNVTDFDRVLSALVQTRDGCNPCPGHPPCADDGCECWTRCLIATEVALWLAKEPVNARRLAAMFKVVEAARAAKLVFISDEWLKAKVPSYQHCDRGQLHNAIKHLEDLEQDLGSAYQSVLDGRM